MKKKKNKLKLTNKVSLNQVETLIKSIKYDLTISCQLACQFKIS